MRATKKYYKMAESCLKSYNMLKVYIAGLESDLEHVQQNDGTCGICYEGEKTGATYKINKLVENVATSNVTSEQLLKKKIQMYKYKLSKIDKALESLEGIEREVIDLFYIKKMKWFEIIDEINVSERNGKRIKNKSIDKIAFILYGVESLECLDKIV